MFKKIVENVGNFISKRRSGSAETLGIFLIVALVFFVLFIWFFCVCHGWLVAAFPTFVAFPKWAFVLLMFILSNGSRGGNSS